MVLLEAWMSCCVSLGWFLERFLQISAETVSHLFELTYLDNTFKNFQIGSNWSSRGILMLDLPNTPKQGKSHVPKPVPNSHPFLLVFKNRDWPHFGVFWKAWCGAWTCISIISLIHSIIVSCFDSFIIYHSFLPFFMHSLIRRSFMHSLISFIELISFIHGFHSFHWLQSLILSFIQSILHLFTLYSFIRSFQRRIHWCRNTLIHCFGDSWT